MDLLGFLKEKAQDSNTEAHPYAYLDDTFKYLYCFGLGVLAVGHMKAFTETKKIYEGILNNIKLNVLYQDRIVIDINNNFDYKIKEVIECLDTKEKQYMFTADLYQIASVTLWSLPYCEQVIQNYVSIFRFTREEQKFFKDFSTAANKKSDKNAKESYLQFKKQGYQVHYSLLQYIYPEFKLEETYENLELINGEKLIIDKPAQITGNIILKNGASLKIINTDIKLSGNIRVDGGKLEISKSRILVEHIAEPYLIQVKNTVETRIEEAVIDCNYCCGLLNQESGRLLINNSKLLHSKRVRMISVTSKECDLNGTKIEDALSGAIDVKKESRLQIDDCRFYNCEAEHGGAVHFSSIQDSSISNCVFQSCNAKFIGGAVYFDSKKFGQNVVNCEFINCYPKDSILFNCYQEAHNRITETEGEDK